MRIDHELSDTKERNPVQVQLREAKLEEAEQITEFIRKNYQRVAD